MNFYKRSGNRVAKLFCSTLCGSPAFKRLLKSGSYKRAKVLIMKGGLGRAVGEGRGSLKSFPKAQLVKSSFFVFETEYTADFWFTNF